MLKSTMCLGKFMKGAVVTIRETGHWHKRLEDKGNPLVNKHTEVTNRILLQHLKTRLEGAKGSWVEELPGVLWAYRTTLRTATGETPFCLVYGSEAVVPAGIRDETARIMQYELEENRQARNFDLATIKETRDKAFAKILHYKSLMMKSYNSKVKLRNFQVGDSVLKEVEISKHVGKFDPN
ncbi:UNVERIFIED_CONTAM: hypothetical protein Sradi_5695500 [Sesamum radiatum]|uniref:Reverse transcriptase domain-containing protein n=1 Tax=Sesamum radiatum TaxID=300843 RepID=A0AAW2L110_SESRA